MPRQKKYPHELLDRGARMVADSGRPIAHVARNLGIHHETLRKWVRRAEADAGVRKDLLSTEEHEELKALRGEVRELRRARTRSRSGTSPPCAPGRSLSPSHS